MVGWATKDEVKKWIEKLVREGSEYDPKPSYVAPTLLQYCTIIVGKERKTCSTEEEAIGTLYRRLK